MQSRFKYLGINVWMAVSFALGLVQAWRSRFFMTFDGISYLDMGDAYLRGDWHTAINGYWNPLYAWIQALARLVLRPSTYWEYPLVHLVDYGIFVVTVFAFEYFLRGLLKEREDTFAIRFIAYAIFLWSTLELCRVFMVNPDMLIAASVYAALGMLLRAPKSAPIALGAALATGYYAKAVMFPIALMILVASFKLLPRRSTLIAATTFILLCAPWIATLSIATSHLTIGDTSRLNYAWYVNNVDRGRFWQGGPPKAGQPVHPPRVILASPRVFEYGGVFPVTFPIWYDQSYWYRGLHIWFAPRLLARAYINNGRSLLMVLGCQGGGFLIAWVLCFLLQKEKSFRMDMARGWIAWLVSLATLLFLCAVHLEPRHIASFIAILFLVPFVALSGPINKILASAIGIGGLAWALSFSSVTTLLGEPMIPFQVTPQNEAWQIANDMERLGLQPHEQFATVCCMGPRSVFWAHLIRAQSVSQLDLNVKFWELSKTDQQRVLAAMASTGAKFVVSEVPPPNPEQALGWQRVGSSNYYAYPLPTDISKEGVSR